MGGIITRDIDQFELKIYETKTKIREHRLAMVNMLDYEISGMASNPVNGLNAFSLLEIEQTICQLEGKRHELEKKRQEAVSRLQNNIMEKTFGKELLPLIPIHMTTGFSTSIPLECQAGLSSFDVRTT